MDNYWGVDTCAGVDGSGSDGGESSAAAMVRKNRELEGLQEVGSCSFYWWLCCVFQQLETARDEIAHMQEERAELKRARREAEVGVSGESPRDWKFRKNWRIST